MKISKDFALHLYFNRIILQINNNYYKETKFDLFIDNVSKLLLNYSNNDYFYTEYNWLTDKECCITDNIGYPIYILLFSIDTNTYNKEYDYMLLKDNKIIINIPNSLHITNNKHINQLKYYKLHLKYVLLYIRILCNKDIFNINNINVYKNIFNNDNINYYIITLIMYFIISENLNRFIKEYITYIENNINNKNDNIENLIIYGSKYNHINEFYSLMNDITIFHESDYKHLFYIGYILNINNIYKNEISYDILESICNNIENMNIDYIIEISNNISNFIYNNYKLYELKLYNITLNILNKNIL